MKKILNPFIWLINILNYFAHVETYRSETNYMKYDFSKDIEYF